MPSPYIVARIFHPGNIVKEPGLRFGKLADNYTKNPNLSTKKSPARLPAGLEFTCAGCIVGLYTNLRTRAAADLRIEVE